MSRATEVMQARRTTTVQITANTEKFLSCPRHPRRLFAYSKWHADRGKEVQVFLPPLTRDQASVFEEPCEGNTFWEMVDGGTLLCQHELDID